MAPSPFNVAKLAKVKAMLKRPVAAPAALRKGHASALKRSLAPVTPLKRPAASTVGSSTPPRKKNLNITGEAVASADSTPPRRPKVQLNIESDGVNAAKELLIEKVLLSDSDCDSNEMAEPVMTGADDDDDIASEEEAEAALEAALEMPEYGTPPKLTKRNAASSAANNPSSSKDGSSSSSAEPAKKKALVVLDHVKILEGDRKDKYGNVVKKTGNIYTVKIDRPDLYKRIASKPEVFVELPASSLQQVDRKPHPNLPEGWTFWERRENRGTKYKRFFDRDGKKYNTLVKALFMVRMEQTRPDYSKLMIREMERKAPDRRQHPDLPRGWMYVNRMDEAGRPFSLFYDARGTEYPSMEKVEQILMKSIASWTFPSESLGDASDKAAAEEAPPAQAV